METIFCRLVSWITDHIRSVKLCMVCFHMLCSLLNLQAHHLWVQFSKSTLFWQIPIQLLTNPKKASEKSQYSFWKLPIQLLTNPYAASDKSTNWFCFEYLHAASGKSPCSKACNGYSSPEAIILSTNKYPIEKGDLIYRVYILDNALLQPEYAFWYQN